jgi:hypothetical protein
MRIFSSASEDWRTPAIYTQAACEVMGAIDLDPASSAVANRDLGAHKFYDKKADGLRRSWHGRVWLNPPYGRIGNTSFAKLWSEKLVEEHAAGRVEQAILLTNASTDAAWFTPLWKHPICFVRRRIRFLRSDGLRAAVPTHASVFVYIGRRRKRFANVFGQFGHIVSP